jgi:hypothetical protein
LIFHKRNQIIETENLAYVDLVYYLKIKNKIKKQLKNKTAN